MSSPAAIARSVAASRDRRFGNPVSSSVSESRSASAAPRASRSARVIRTPAATSVRRATTRSTQPTADHGSTTSITSARPEAVTRTAVLSRASGRPSGAPGARQPAATITVKLAPHSACSAMLAV